MDLTTDLLFYGTCLLLGVLVLGSLHRVKKTLRGGASMFAASAALATWLALNALIGFSGLLMPSPGKPPWFLAYLALVTAGTALIAASSLGDRLIRGLPIWWLAGFQCFRVPVELFLDLGYRDGAVPIQMTFEGNNFDILAGASALIILLVWRGKTPPRPLIWIWNLGSLGLLVNIVIIAVLSAPTPLRVFHNEPANVFVTAFPYVWLPGFLVQAAWLGHLLVFRYLWRTRSAA